MVHFISGWRRWVTAGLWLLLRAALCQVPGAVVTTTVQDTVYRADGTPAQGTVLLSWGAFTTVTGESIPAGSTSVTLGTNGALSVALAPNAGATPMASFYTAVLHLNDGTTSRQFWVVPMPLPGGAPVTLASVVNQVLPLSVAMQTVSKQYVDNAVAQIRSAPVLPAYSHVSTGLTTGTSFTLLTVPTTAMWRIDLASNCTAVSAGAAAPSILWTDTSGNSQTFVTNQDGCNTGQVPWMNQSLLLSLKAGTTVTVNVNIGPPVTYDIRATATQLTTN